MTTEQTIALRIAGPTDAARIANLGERTFYDAFASSNAPADMATYLRSAFGPERQAAELTCAGSTFLLAEADSTAVGYARLLAGDVPACVSGPRPLELNRLYVLTGWQSRGVGSLLMRRCLSEARSGRYATLWLGVWEHNPDAVRFYQRWGFEVVGERTFTLGSDRQTDLVMERRLV